MQDEAGGQVRVIFFSASTGLIAEALRTIHEATRNITNIVRVGFV